MISDGFAKADGDLAPARVSRISWAGQVWVRRVEATMRMGWDDRPTLGATIFAAEIASVTEEGGGGLLRERLASLGAGERRVLRRTLDAARAPAGLR